MLSGEDLAFALRMRAMPDALAARREAAPAPKVPDDSVDPDFFNYLYGVGSSQRDARRLPRPRRRGSEVVGGVFSYFNWAEDYSFGSECAYSDSKGGTEGAFGYNKACNTTNVMYDTTTTVDWTETGGSVGLESIGSAAHGGVYTRTGDVTLTSDLVWSTTPHS